MQKACNTCGQLKSLGEFRPHPRSADGRMPRCEACILLALEAVRAKRRAERQEKLARDGGKVCVSCGVLRPVGMYVRRKNTVDGLMSRCNQCETERWRRLRAADPKMAARKMRAYYWKDPEKFRERAREWSRSNPDKRREMSNRAHRVTGWAGALAGTCRVRARKLSLPQCDFDGAYLEGLLEQQGGRCHWLGIPLVPSLVHRDPRRPSVDRLDLAKGYVRGNVVLACQFANMGRSTTDADSFSVFLSELIEHVQTT